MNKKLLFVLALLPSFALAGSGTIYFGPGGGTITISSGTAAGGGGSPLTFIQAVSTSTTSGGCGSTSVMTPTAGHLLVLGCETGSNFSGINISDNVGDVWLKAGVSTGTTTSDYMGIWYVASAVGGATTVTAATGGCNGVNYCVLAEYSGQAASPFDVFSSSMPLRGAGLNPITTLAATTTGTNELMFSFANVGGGGSTVTSQTGTSRYVNLNANGWLAQDANVAAAGVYTSTWTITSPYTWGAVQAAFKPQ